MNPDQNLVLTPEDWAFIQRVVDDVTEKNMLPFSLPPASLPDVIRKSAQFFYEEYDDAVEERWLVIRYEDIQRDPTLNAVIQLPDAIQGVGQLYTTNGGFSFGSPIQFLRDNILYGGGYLGAINGISGFGGAGGYVGTTDRREMYEQTVVSIFAYNSDKTLFKKGTRFSFNMHTHRLNIMGKPNGHLIFQAFQRVPLAELYNSRWFFDHVRGSVMERLQKIIGLFDFQYPGNVKINFDSIQKLGTELREKVETDIKEESSGADLFFMT